MKYDCLTHCWHRGQGHFIENTMLGFDDSMVRLFENYAHLDPRWPIGANNQGLLVNEADHFDNRSFEKTEFYNEVLYKADVRHSLTINLPISSESVAGFAMLRPKSMGAFTERHVQNLNIMLPHVWRALKLQGRLRSLENEHKNVIAALDRLPAAGFIVSEKLKVMSGNRKANRLFSENETLPVRHGILTLDRPNESSALRKAVATAVRLADGTPGESSPPEVVTIARNGKRPLELLVVPLRPQHQLRQQAGSEARALILVYDHELRPRVDVAALEVLFHFTFTEAKIAAQIAEGLSIADIAKDRHCLESTIRSHMKSIFRKTQTNRQAELVQLILTTPAVSFE